MKVILLVIVWLLIYIWRSVDTVLSPITIPAHTSLPSQQVIQTKLLEIGRLEVLEAEYQVEYKAKAQTLQFLKDDTRYKQLLNSFVDRLTKDEIILTAKGKVIVWFDFASAKRDMRQTWDILVIKTQAQFLHSAVTSIVVSERNTGILKKITGVDLALEEYARQEWLDHIVAQAEQDKILDKTYVLGEQILTQLFEVFGIKKVVILKA